MGAAEGWSGGAKALPATPRPIPSLASGASTANPCVYFSRLVPSRFQSTKVLHCSICFCGISSPAGSRRHSKFRDGKKKIMDLVRFCLLAKLTKARMPAEPSCGRSIPGPHRFHPLPTFQSLLVANHAHSQSLSGRCTKPDPAVGAGNGQIIQVAEFISPFPLVANCPGADGDFLKCIRYSKSLTETAMAQTNPRPPAKPSFGLSICPAAAVGVGSAPASAPEGTGRQESSGWGRPRRLRLPPASSLCRGRDPRPSSAGLWSCTGSLAQCLRVPAMG